MVHDAERIYDYLQMSYAITQRQSSPIVKNTVTESRLARNIKEILQLSQL